MPNEIPRTYDLIICGGGPSGLAAAMYAGRSNMDVLLIDKGAPGGVMNITARIDNYIGFHDGISGIELASNFEKHVRRYVPTENIVFDVVEELTMSPENPCVKFVKTSNDFYRCHTAIIATGSNPRILPIENHNSWLGRGLSYCAICDGAFFNGKRVAVMGGGNAAVEEGIYLTRFASKVTIIHRRDELRASMILQEEAFANPKIEFIWDSIVTDLHGENLLEELTIRNVKTNAERRIPADGIFVYIGATPNADFVKIDGLKRDESGYLWTDEFMCVGIPGLYATGDVRDFPLRQISISTGNGAIAALMAEKYLHELKRQGLYCGIGSKPK